MDLVDLTLALLDKIEEEYAAPLSDTLEAAMDYVQQDVLQTHSIRPLTRPLKLAITRIMTNCWLASTTGVSVLMREEFKDGFPDLESKANAEAEIHRIVNDYVTSYGGQRAAQVIQTTERQIADLINGGLSRGEAVSAVSQNVSNKIPELAEIRGLLVTRTEAHASAQFASQKMAERSAIALKKVWNTRGDQRVRDFGTSGRVSEFNHRVMDLQQIPLTSTFKVPRRFGVPEALLFPGDPNGSAGNVINCRCIQTYVRA